MEAEVERECSAAAAMLGLPGFVVLAVSDYDGECEQAVKTTVDLVGFPGVWCGSPATRPAPVLGAGSARRGRPVILAWIKRVWRCPHRFCPKRTWPETSAVIAPRASLRRRARVEICRRVGENGASVTAVAREFGSAGAPRSSRP
jgi:transposase